MKNALFGMLLVCAASASNNVFAQTAAERSAAEQDREQAKIAIKAVVEAMKHGDKADFEALGITLDELKVFCKASGGCQVTRDEAEAIASAKRKVNSDHGGHKSTKKDDDSDGALSQELLDLHVMLAVSMSGTDKVVADNAAHFADSQLRVLNHQSVEYKASDSTATGTRPAGSAAAGQVATIMNPPTAEKVAPAHTCPNGFYWKNELIMAQAGTIRDGDMVMAQRDNSGCFPIAGWQPPPPANLQLPANYTVDPNQATPAASNFKEERICPIWAGALGGLVILGGAGAGAGYGIGAAAHPSHFDPTTGINDIGQGRNGALIGGAIMSAIGAGAGMLICNIKVKRHAN